LKKFLALFVALMAVVCVTASVAVAGNGSTTTQFNASYLNARGGYFTCSGVRIVKDAPKAFIKDSETCIITDLASWPAGTYQNVGGWASDYDFWTLGQLRISVSNTFVITDNGDGTGTLEISAYYN
jgi:hypothetical protein